MKSCTFKAVTAAILLLLGASGAFAQTGSITGVVSDTRGPVVGATVMVKGTSRGSTTDAQGNFTISATRGDTLSVSFIGYHTQDVVVGQQTKLSILLTEDTQQIEDVVVVGFGTQRRADLTTAVSSANIEDMKKFSASNVAEMLRGRVAGVTVTNTGGRPGTASSIEIRGVRSLRSGAVLYVIDGVVATEREFQTIAAEEIENIDVAKDAAGQAIYGARAADGIIYVTTKKGKAGEYRVNVNTKVQWTSLPRKRNFSLYTPQEWYNLRAEAQAADLQKATANIVTGADLVGDPEAVLADHIMEEMYASGQSTDWEKLMFKTALMQQYDVSVSGGNEKMRMSAMAGYLDQDGMLKTGSGYQRGNLRMNMDITPKKWINLGFGASFMKSKQQYEDGRFTYFITRPPLGKPYDAEGNITKFINAVQDQNPLWNEAAAKDERDADYGNVNAYLEIMPVKGLSLRTTFSYRNEFTESGDYNTMDYPGGSGGAGSLTNTKRNIFEMSNVATYKAPFTNKDHKLSLVGIHSYYTNNYSSLSYKANNLPTDDFWWDGLADGVVSTKGRGKSKHVIISYAARAEYSFKDRYMANVVIRRDGSSKFGPKNKWGTFPAASVAWRISEEPFIKNISQIDNIKLRFSYGIVGSESDIDNYTTNGLASGYEYEFGDVYYYGYLPGTTLSNPYMKWEQTESTNIGIDFGFLGRINGEMNYYITNTNDLLANRTIENVSGYTSYTDNVAKTRSWGFELAMNGDIIRKHDLRWNAGMTFATFNNKILKLTGKLDADGKPADDPGNTWFIGHPIGVYYEYKSDGIFQYSDFDVVNGEYKLRPTIDSDDDGIPDKIIERTDVVYPGKVKIIDRNGDGKIDGDDRFIIPRATKWNMSISTSLEYKGFDFFMDWYGVYGRKIQNAYLSAAGNGGSLQGKLNGVKVNYWTPTNPSNEFPRPAHNSNTNYHDVLNLQDASYVRLRTLSLGYTLPYSITSKIAMQSMRVYCTLNNVFTKSDFISYNPESTLNGYPEGLQVLLGINITF